MESQNIDNGYDDDNDEDVKGLTEVSRVCFTSDIDNHSTVRFSFYKPPRDPRQPALNLFGHNDKTEHGNGPEPRKG